MHFLDTSHSIPTTALVGVYIIRTLQGSKPEHRVIWPGGQSPDSNHSCTTPQPRTLMTANLSCLREAPFWGQRKLRNDAETDGSTWKGGFPYLPPSPSSLLFQSLCWTTDAHHRKINMRTPHVPSLQGWVPLGPCASFIYNLV